MNGVPIKDIDVKYIEVIGVEKAMSNKVSVRLDFGQDSKYFSANVKSMVIKDELGKKVEFNSVVDALNFMDKLGWKFIAVYGVGLNSGVKESHFVMKKEDI